MTLISIIVIYSVGLIASSGIGIPFVSFILSKFSPKTTETEADIQHAGKTIGFFERIVVTVLVFLGSYEAISFVLAAKSIARFGQLQKREFAEYYLIGTFASIAFALLVAILTVKIAEII